MAKEPVPGRVKTRLAPELGDRMAALLYQAFLEDLAERMASLDAVERVLAIWPPRLDAPWLEPYRERFRCVVQRGATLSERMRAVVADAFADGAGSVLVLGTDVPTLPIEHVTEACGVLAAGAPVVLGPDPDGGYYAIGLSRFVPELFDVPMSTDRVLAATVGRARASGLGVALLPSWADVDEPADLKRLRTELADPCVAARAPRTARLLATLPSPGA